MALSVDVEAPGVLCGEVAVGAGGVRVGYLRAAFGAVDEAILLAVCAAFELEDPIVRYCEENCYGRQCFLCS